MHTNAVVTGRATASLMGLVLLLGCSAAGADNDARPRFTPEGRLVRPQGWESWVMVGSSTGLSYAEAPPPAPGEAPGMFHNVYMQPWAYRYFMERGIFAQGTMFAMTFYEASRKADPARAGFYEGDRAPVVEVHLKQDGIDPSGWAFFNFPDTVVSAEKVPGSVSCYGCHAREAAFDNVFTQFYPPLRERLARKATTRP